MLYTLIVVGLLASGETKSIVVDTHITKEQCLIKAGAASEVLNKEASRNKQYYKLNYQLPDHAVMGGDIHCNKMLGSAEDDVTNVAKNTTGVTDNTTGVTSKYRTLGEVK